MNYKYKGYIIEKVEKTISNNTSNWRVGKDEWYGTKIQQTSYYFKTLKEARELINEWKEEFNTKWIIENN